MKLHAYRYDVRPQRGQVNQRIALSFQSLSPELADRLIIATDAQRGPGGGPDYDGQQLLQNFVEHSCPSMPQARSIPAGEASLPMHRTSGRRLNPRFCEWSLGWPTGWTNCAESVTGFARWLERSRTELLPLISPPTLLPGNEPDGQGRLL